MSQPDRSKAESMARRNVRTIARHLGHISKDASPVVLAELHGNVTKIGVRWNGDYEERHGHPDHVIRIEMTP